MHTETGIVAGVAVGGDSVLTNYLIIQNRKLNVTDLDLNTSFIAMLDCYASYSIGFKIF